MELCENKEISPLSNATHALDYVDCDHSGRAKIHSHHSMGLLILNLWAILKIN
jgi:hypothetical protein